MIPDIHLPSIPMNILDLGWKIVMSRFRFSRRGTEWKSHVVVQQRNAKYIFRKPVFLEEDCRTSEMAEKASKFQFCKLLNIL